ncbi:hypothetical protein LXL04_017507 [Taraxacum kok-saghyz]
MRREIDGDNSVEEVERGEMVAGASIKFLISLIWNMVSGNGMENWIGTVDDDTEINIEHLTQSIWPDRESKINTTDRECYPKCPMVFTFFFVTLFRSCLHCSATKRTTISNREKESQASLPSSVDRGAILISDCASSALGDLADCKYEFILIGE